MAELQAMKRTRTRAPNEIGAEKTNLRFTDELRERSRDRSLMKRERTRAHLLCVGSERLDENPKCKLTIECILDSAGLSRGTFYNHFSDIEDYLACLVSEFLKGQKPRAKSGDVSGSGQHGTFASNLWFCRAYEANVGLYALFSSLSAHNADLLKLREKTNAAWVHKIVRIIEGRRGQRFLARTRSEFSGALRMLIAMTIETLRERYLHLDELLCQSFQSTEEVAEMLTKIWHMTIVDFQSRP